MTQSNKNWPSQSPQNIIVRMPNWLGDVVMATPILADLRTRWKNARITAMCQSNVAAILKNDPNINELFSYRRPSGWIHRTEHTEIIEPLRNGKFDLGILSTNSFSSAWWFWRGNVKNRIGFSDNFRQLFLNKSVPFPKNVETQHLVNTYKSLLIPLGIELSTSSPKLYITNEEKNWAKSLLDKYRVIPGKDIIIGINPGAAYGSAKCWLPDRFVSVSKRLLENPKNCIIYFGDPAGAPLVNKICEELPSERVINLAGATSLRELLALINCCSIFLTNDSGPMHIASALGIPLLALFGSTSDVRTGPYNIGKVLHKHVACSPCYKRECPIDFKCMTQIGVDEVYNQLEEIINESNKRIY